MIKKLSLLMIFSFSSFAASSGSLLLSTRVGVNIDYRIDENNNIRIISNAPFKKNMRPYSFKSRNTTTANNNNSFKVLEIAAN